jgi:hypothetical protein
MIQKRKPVSLRIGSAASPIVVGIGLLLLIVWAAHGVNAGRNIVSHEEQPVSTTRLQAVGTQDVTQTIYLPAVVRYYDPSWIAPWGVQTWDYDILDKATEAGMHWIRVPLKWEDVEGTQGSYDWGTYDIMFTQAVSAGLVPIVTIHSNPLWADADNNNCGPLNATGELAWADFLEALVTRYGPGTEYGVRHWEIGNEIDVTYEDWLNTYWPQHNGGIGCWGDKVSEYVAFLQTAHNAIMGADPNAVVLMGTLAFLENTNMDFLDQVLRAGAAQYFDMVGFTFYQGQDDAWYTCTDLDPTPGHVCQGEKGMRGMGTIFHDILAQHGVEKQVMASEIAGRCFPKDQDCTPEGSDIQGYKAVIYNVEAMSVDVAPTIWFTLDYPGFYHSSLLDENDNPRPSHVAYQMLTSELYGGRFVRQMSASEVGSAVEGHVISTAGGTKEKYVLWRKSSGTSIVSFHLSAVQTVTRNDMTIETTAIQDGQAYVGVSVGEAPVIVSQYP